MSCQRHSHEHNEWHTAIHSSFEWTLCQRTSGSSLIFPMGMHAMHAMCVYVVRVQNDDDENDGCFVHSLIDHKIEAGFSSRLLSDLFTFSMYSFPLTFSRDWHESRHISSSYARPPQRCFRLCLFSGCALIFFSFSPSPCRPRFFLFFLALYYSLGSVHCRLLTGIKHHVTCRQR